MSASGSSPRIDVEDGEHWAEHAAACVMSAVSRRLKSGKRCSVMLTGGNSAEKLYCAWAVREDFRHANGIDFYFGDERCVLPDSGDSNYRTAEKSLFRYGIPGDCSLSRIEAESPDREQAARDYEAALPESLDVLLLGVGTDGHVASIFPHGEALREKERKVMPVMGDFEPRERITITPPVIADAEEVILLAPGRHKSAVLARAQEHPADTSAMPVRLALDATWLLDTALPEPIQEIATQC